MGIRRADFPAGGAFNSRRQSRSSACRSLADLAAGAGGFPILARQMGDNAAELAQLAPSLRRVFPDIPQPLELPPAQKRRYIFQSVTDGLAHAARSRSYVLMVEDLHWADESTLALLIHLANRV